MLLNHLLHSLWVVGVSLRTARDLNTRQPSSRMTAVLVCSGPQYHSRIVIVKMKLSAKKYGWRALGSADAPLSNGGSKGLPPPPVSALPPLERAVVVDAAADDVVDVFVLMEENEVAEAVVDVEVSFESSVVEEEVSIDDDVCVVAVLRSVEESVDGGLLEETIDPVAVAAIVTVFVDAAVVLSGATVVVVVSVWTTGSHRKSTPDPTKSLPINEFRSAVSRLHARWTAD